MDQSNVPPLPVSPPEDQKHSRLGKASLWIGILTPLIVVCLVGALYFWPQSFGDDGNGLIIIYIYVAILFLSFFTSLLGIGLGIRAIQQKRRKKLPGILGLVLNTAFLLFVAYALLQFFLNFTI